MNQLNPIFQPGQLVGQYRVTRQAGAGGMGNVYLAEDTRLHRQVALKVVTLPGGVDTEARERLMREAQTLAALNHPNIVSLFDVVDCDGCLVMVMEWIEGQPLTELLGQLSPEQVTAIAREIAAALAAAHKAGIIHGDIKPSNIILQSNDRIRLLDFGISRTERGRGYPTGSYSGTIPYMAPELFRGDNPSPCSDLFSLGVFLYELASGHKPFTGDYEAAIEYAILNTDPAPITSVRPEIPASLAGAVHKLLSRERNARYQSTEELLTDLNQDERSARPAGRRTLLPYIIVIVLVAVLFAALLPWLGNQDGRAPANTTPSIAILPFENLGDASQEYFADGLTDAIIASLSKDTQLSVISRSGVMPYKRSTKDLSDIAEELSVDYILIGNIQRSSDTADSRVRISAALVDPASRRNLWAETYDRRLQDLFAVYNELSQKVRDAFKLRGLISAEVAPPTQNLQAYDFYLRGNDYFNRGWSSEDIRFAIDMYQRAIAEDSTFAVAYAMLARGHASMFWEYYDRSPSRCEKARAAADRALALSPGLAEAHLARGYCFYHCDLDFIRALEEFHLALQRSPKNAEVLNAVAAVERRQGNLQMAAEHFEASLQLDPRSYLKAFDVGLTYGLMREYDKANQYLDRAITLGPDWPLAHVYKAWLAILHNGDVTSAADILARAPREANLRRSHYYWWLQRIVLPDLTSIPVDVPAMDDTAAYYLYKSQINRLLGKSALERQYADSARLWIEPRLASAPHAARYCSYLGLAYAGLRNKPQALRYGQQALQLLPASRDSFDALFLLINMAEILVVTEEYDQAVGQIQMMLTMPGFVSIPYFQADPLWKPLHSNSAYQQVIGLRQ